MCLQTYRGGRGMRRVGGKEGIWGGGGKAGREVRESKGKGEGMTRNMGGKSRERGMPIKLTKQGSEKCQDEPLLNQNQRAMAPKMMLRNVKYVLCCKVCTIPHCCASVGTRFPDV